MGKSHRGHTVGFVRHLAFYGVGRVGGPKAVDLRGLRLDVLDDGARRAVHLGLLGKNAIRLAMALAAVLSRIAWR